ncbi:DUF3313 domain-containing protein [Pleomorphomonas oryzae]|uniref:DUF3313 domain-containing protein n=1 Tax=Pleomorphomonas oryzae TaxID=261934 RepID=UPI0004036833|nr:DUF3313 domain-containing protein [Pleomorphomonas oryzae]
MLLLASGLILAGCASAPLDEAGHLRSYANLRKDDGLLTRSLVSVDKPHVLAAKTVNIVPTAFATSVEAPFTPDQRGLVANAIDRSLCEGLSERFTVVPPWEPADLTVHATVTHATPTSKIAAGLSKGASVASVVLLPEVPVPVPRVPFGLGSLSIEAEASDLAGEQRAAMVWARGANALTDPGPIADNGDAYTLAGSFGDDFSSLLVTGTSPFQGGLSLPSMQAVGNYFGREPKYAACKAFGRNPGVIGTIGNMVGAPPSWTDGGAVSPGRT